MSILDITTSISSNPIKNGASVVLVNKNGSEVLFDNSKDTELGLETFNNLTNNRFDDTTYYLPRGMPS